MLTHTGREIEGSEKRSGVDPVELGYYRVALLTVSLSKVVPGLQVRSMTIFG
jgi:hypothetical protein